MSFETDLPNPSYVEELAQGVTTHLSRRFDLSFSYDVLPVGQPVGHEYDSPGTFAPWFSSPRVLGYEVRLHAAPHEHVRENAPCVPVGSVYVAESPIVRIANEQFRDETHRFLTGR